MSVRKLTATLLTALAFFGVVTNVKAQDHMPVVDPFAFDPDFNWFEPVYDMDLADMKPKKRAYTGWFGTYDRLNLYGSQPEINSPNLVDSKLDSGWGHRYEVGFMLPEEKGWLFNWTSNEVGAADIVRREALNRFNGDQTGNAADGGGGAGDSVTTDLGFIVPPGEANNSGFSYRFYDVGRTTNVFTYDSYELNKTWRLEPYHYGGILEPMVGVRWMRLDDTNQVLDYRSTRDEGPEFNLTVNGDLLDDAEQITRQTAITENEMLGPQLGFRYFKFRDRFIFSGNFIAFAGGSYQCSKFRQTTDIVAYAGDTGGDAIDFILHDATPSTYTRNEEFFVGFDARGEIGYQLTKMISIRAGFQVIDIARGVWRGGNNPNIGVGDNDQDVVMVGGTFGINLNH